MKTARFLTGIATLLLMGACCSEPHSRLTKTTWDNFALDSSWEFEYVNFTFTTGDEVKAVFLEYNSPNRKTTGTYSYDDATGRAEVVLDGDTTVCTVSGDHLRFYSPDSVLYVLKKRSRYHKPGF